MQCAYFDVNECRSCTWMGQSYPEQLGRKQEQATAALAEFTGPGWEGFEPIFSGPSSHFRNKAKLAVGGTTQAPTLGVLDQHYRGVDLEECGIYEPGLRPPIAAVRELITRAQLVPYQVESRRGELKYAILTLAPSGKVLVRLVLRSTEALSRLRKHLPWFLDRCPQVEVFTANLQPEPKAILEGPEEIYLTQQRRLQLRVGQVDYLLGAQSFFQTNTTVAAALYETVATWVGQIHPHEIWDLYCGVGGFALQVAPTVGGVPQVRGVEVSPEAAQIATEAAQLNGREATFTAGDAATAFARAERSPDLVIVNPPRRGLGSLAGELAQWAPPTVLYSSCSLTSLVKDLRQLPRYRIKRARVLDMFPQTAHFEVAVELQLRDSHSLSG